MTVIIPHKTTADKAIAKVDQSSDSLFELPGGGPIQLVDKKKSWDGRTMNFSLTAKMGFIALPISGTVVVDDTNVTVHCELPRLIKSLGGEDVIRSGIENKVRGLLT